MIPWILISIAVLVVLLGILAFVVASKRNKKMPTDYYSFFIIGIIWLGAGILMNISDNTSGAFFLILGITYMVLGLSHKKEWKKNHEANKWKNLSKFEKRVRLWIYVVVGIVVLVGLVAFLLVWF